MKHFLRFVKISRISGQQAQCKLSFYKYSSSFLLISLKFLVAECLSQVCSNLPLDKAMKLSTSWCTGNSSRLLTHYQGNRVAAEVAMFVQFIFTQCGLSVNDFPIFREVKLFLTVEIYFILKILIF